MHYYKRNLGDYAKKAGRLSMLQHGSYTLLIDACYDREQFPTRDEAIDWTWASSAAEIEAVDFVLAKFFVLENGVYVQTRIRDELVEYHQKAITNKRIADERETKRKENSTNRAQVVNEPPPNHEPLTINHEPLTKEEGKAPRKRSTPFSAPDCPEDVNPQVFTDWLTLRRNKRAPVTATTIAEARKEAGKADMTFEQFLITWCVRGSQGLLAEWVRPGEKSSETAYQKSMRLRVAEISPSLARAPPGQTNHVEFFRALTVVPQLLGNTK